MRHTNNNDDWFEMFGAGFVVGAFTLGLILAIWRPYPTTIQYTPYESDAIENYR